MKEKSKGVASHPVKKPLLSTSSGAKGGKEGDTRVLKEYTYTAKIHKIRNGGALISVGRIIPHDWDYVLVKSKTMRNKVLIEITPININIEE
jgi:hypothetical protein